MSKKTYFQCTMKCGHPQHDPGIQKECKDCFCIPYPDFLLAEQITEVNGAGNANVRMKKSQAFDLVAPHEVRVSVAGLNLPKGTRVRIRIEVINE